MFWIGIFSIVGIVIGGFGEILYAYLYNFVVQLPNLDNPDGAERISEFMGLMQGLVIYGIFESTKQVYRRYYSKPGEISFIPLSLKHPVKIGIIGALSISLMIAIASIYTLTETELHIAKKELVVKAKVSSYEGANQWVESFVYKKTNMKKLPPHLEYSIRNHPIALSVIFLSCFIFFWTTMPKGLRAFCNFLGEIEG